MEISSTFHPINLDSVAGISNPDMQKQKKPSEPTNKEDQQSNIDSVVLSNEGRLRDQNSALTDTDSNSAKQANGFNALDKMEIQQVQRLKRRDTEVRTHEQAHLSTAGQYARGGASYTYQRGPDGVAYAVGGEVGIDLSKEKSAEATVAKMQTIKRAALAPASPSPADRSIAAQATLIESEARKEVFLQRQEDVLHPALAKENSTSQQSENMPPSPQHSVIQAMLAAYQRTAG